MDERKAVIERLVCNFAPKGNIHGKPVYAIGYPATQCQQNKIPDRKFSSLCQYLIEHNGMLYFALLVVPINHQILAHSNEQTCT